MSHCILATKNNRLSREKLTPHNKIMIIFQHREDYSIIELTFNIDEITKMNTAITKYTVDKRHKSKPVEHDLIEMFTFYHERV